MPPSRTREDRDNILEEIASARRQVAEDDERRLDRVDKLLKFIYGLVAVIVGVTLYVAKLQWTVGVHDEMIRDMNPKVSEMWFMKLRGINNKP